MKIRFLKGRGALSYPNKFAVFLLAAMSISFIGLGQNVTISGYVRDHQTKESLIGASIYATNHKSGTVTNTYGFYSLTIPIADTLGLVFSYVGYESQAKKVMIIGGLRLDVFLDQDFSELQEVVVNGDRNGENVSKAQMSVIDVPMISINSLPILGGERDVLKILQFLPGIQQGQEGTTGFYVRGGNSDQNLIQLDEATIYNPNHLFGLFSTFNSNAIKSVSIMKGGFPSKYGGRLSSIVNITTKDGNKEEFNTEGGIGLLSANLTVQGPLEKGKSSFIISGRRSYIDLLAKPFVKNINNPMNYLLYDLNVKLNYDLGKNDQLFISYFTGRDDVNYVGTSGLNFNMSFGNTTNTVRWNHIYGEKWFSNTSIILNDYHLALNSTQGNYYSLLYTGIKDVTAKSDFIYAPSPNREITIGFSYTNHAVYPGALSAKVPKKGNRIDLNRADIRRKYADEMAVYINDEIKLNDRISASYGVRMPVYNASNKSYSFLEPRVTAKYSISASSSIKASYTQMNQFVHLVPNSTASMPTNIWLASNSTIKPQNSTQYALGYFKNLKNNEIETSIEGYYKNMSNQVLFKEGTQLDADTNFDEVLTFGNGKSYGVEFFAKKKFGKVTGWVSYTLSKTTQKFPDLNGGNAFPFTYDRRHNLSTTAVYQFSNSWTFSSNFTYYTGQVFTMPGGKVFATNEGSLYDNIYYDYTTRNNARLKDYSRLDVNFSNKKVKMKNGRSFEREWVFGAYNVLNRRNPYFIYLTTDYITKAPKAKQVSLLPIIPSISYHFKF
jgi:hypothetical protein